MIPKTFEEIELLNAVEVRLNKSALRHQTYDYSKDDFIGYSAILDNPSYDDLAVVIENAEILAIPKDDFLQMVYNDISIALKFIHIISKNEKEMSSGC